MSDYAKFVRRFGKRIAETNLSNQEMYEIYRGDGEEAFLTTLETEEAFGEFCKEYYDFLREKWNACSASMRDAFEQFQKEFESDSDKYWSYLRKKSSS